MANEWQKHLKKVREENKGKSVGEIAKLASKTYKQGKK